MSREKIKVPGKVYEELVALQREIHFTQDHQDTIKKAQDQRIYECCQLDSPE